MTLDLALLATVLRAVTPILFAALAGALCQQAGVFNISLEGTMLIGCFAAVAGSWFTGDPWLGVLAAVLAAAAYSLILAVGSVVLGGDAIVVSIAMNLLAVGLTGFLLRTVFGTTGSFTDPGLHGLAPVLFGQSLLVYLAWVAVAGLVFVLYRTTWGLTVRGVGDNATAAADLGVNVTRVQVVVIVVSGALCGLGGAQLALGNVTLFADGMTAGRGWIAVVAVMLGMARPVGVLLAALLFGLAEALGFRLQGLGLPQQATDAAPYVVTLLALFLQRRLARRRTREPA